MLVKHQNVENTEQFDKTMDAVLRQKRMQYLETDLNYQMGFNHAWVALQGTVRENVIDQNTYKQLQATVSQLKAENATLSTEVELLSKNQKTEAPAQEEVKPVTTPKPRARSRAKPKPPTE